MNVERGGKAIIATIVGAMFVAWAMVILTEVSFIVFAIGVPVFLALLVAWVLQKPREENTESEVPSDSNTD